MSGETSPRRPETAKLPERQRAMVFLVDDQAMVAEAVRRQLADQADIDFHYCAKADEALALAMEIKPTVILQDLIMPGIDGLDLVRRFRRRVETRDIPIIVLSTREDPQVKSDAFTAGANDYLVKLPEKPEMLARLRYHSRAYLSRIERDEAYRALRQSQRQLIESNMTLTQLSEKLRQNNEALEAAERLAKIGNWSWEFEGNRVVWSDMLRAIFFWDQDRPAPQLEEMSAIFTPASLLIFTAAMRELERTGKTYQLDLEAIRTDGSRFFIHAKGHPAQDETGRIVRGFGTIHDVTEQVRLGEAAQHAAVLEERARIAGDIHDSLAQSFAAIVMQAEVAEEMAEKDGAAQVRGPLLKVRDLARAGLAEARQSAFAMGPSPALQDGLVPAARNLFVRASIPDRLACEVKVSGSIRRLDPRREHEIFRVVQEALNNAVRHAKASQVTLTIRFRSHETSLLLVDNGVGFAADGNDRTEGLGLSAMRERIEKIGGTFSLTSRVGRGTRLTMTIPEAPSAA